MCETSEAGLDSVFQDDTESEGSIQQSVLLHRAAAISACEEAGRFVGEACRSRCDLELPWSFVPKREL